MGRRASAAVVIALILYPAGRSHAQGSFVNWENPPLHALELAPDGDTLLVAHTADQRLEVYDIATGIPVPSASIPVGIDPVSVRARTATEVWVVNHISDSVSVVDLEAENVIATLPTDDEPYDVIFAGSPERAFVSCSQANRVLVFDPEDLSLDPIRIPIAGEDPRALAVSPDGKQVYVAIFESGNGTTILGGGIDDFDIFDYPPNAVSHPDGPHGGLNPPPNSGLEFDPPKNPLIPDPPPVGLIVRRDDDGQWFDDNGGNWTERVSGDLAAESGRPEGWDLLDHDVAVIDAQTLGVSYVDRLMNLCMGLAINPQSGEIAVVGTDATNEIRFEPLLSGRFLRVHLALVDPAGPGGPNIVDLNAHLGYTTSTVPQVIRDFALGDPRGIAFTSAGDRAYITGRGSNNLVIVDAKGHRIGNQPTIEVGAGPIAVVVDEPRARLYVLNHHEASISVVDTRTELEIARIPLYDPTPASIRVGRKHLYDTHETSGLGHIACASCHVDGRMDRLAWDLGDPSGAVKPFNQNCFFGTEFSCASWHPMKGPMTTQTFQDIIGKEPHHWRGDRDGIEEFNGAFSSLLGDDRGLTAAEMQEFEDFLATLTFPPNPFRHFDNSLPRDLPLEGHYTGGRFGPAGQPMPAGNAQRGLERFRFGGLDDPGDCVTCHTLPTGLGTGMVLVGTTFVEIPPGPNGEQHHSLRGLAGSTNHAIKIPQLRNLYDKVGFEATQLQSRAGFGFLHDGSVDSLVRFVEEPTFGVQSDQEVADLVAFLLSFSGSDLPLGSVSNPFRPPGPPSRDTHAAVGKQITVDGANNTSLEVGNFLSAAHALADDGAVGVVAKGVQEGTPRGYVYVGGGMYQSDRVSEMISAVMLQLSATTGSEVTFTVVPEGSQFRIGVDRDEDGVLDHDEIDGCSDPADPTVVPPIVGCHGQEFVRGDCDRDGQVSLSDPIYSLAAIFAGGETPGCLSACDLTADGNHALTDALYSLHYLYVGGSPPPAPFPGCGPEVPGGVILGCLDFGACP